VLGTVLSSDKVFADETTLPVLEPGRGKTKTGRLWTSYGLSTPKMWVSVVLRTPTFEGSIAPCSRCPERCAPAQRAGAALRHSGQSLRAALCRWQVGTRGCRVQPNKRMMTKLRHLPLSMFGVKDCLVPQQYACKAK
jgi:hypothetical protein